MKREPRTCLTGHGTPKKAYATEAIAQSEAARIESEAPTHKNGRRRLEAYPCEAHGWHLGSHHYSHEELMTIGEGADGSGNVRYASNHKIEEYRKCVAY